MTTHKEIEARFLEIDKNDLVARLKKLGAVDKGEELLEEIIFYDPALTWRNESKFVRLRKSGGVVTLTYKHNKEQTIDSATELEVEISDIRKAEELIEEIGLVAFRHQEKRRHTFTLGGVTIDIDTWPRIPAYVEIEGDSEANIREAAERLGFDWSGAVFDDARFIIEKRYAIPVSSMRWFTFDRFE